MITNNLNNTTVGMNLFKTDSEHLTSSSGRVSGKEKDIPAESTGFSNLVTGALQQVSDMQINADNLFERMLTHPDEVQPHEISIAISKAELGLNMTWVIVDRAVKAYNNITAMR